MARTGVIFRTSAPLLLRLRVRNDRAISAASFWSLRATYARSLAPSEGKSPGTRTMESITEGLASDAVHSSPGLPPLELTRNFGSEWPFLPVRAPEEQ